MQGLYRSMPIFAYKKQLTFTKVQRYKTKQNNRFLRENTLDRNKSHSAKDLLIATKKKSVIHTNQYRDKSQMTLKIIKNLSLI